MPTFERASRVALASHGASALAFAVGRIHSPAMACPRETLLSALENIAPPHLAEAWDNVGLIVDPGEVEQYRKLIITVDLTGPVLDEAIEEGADFVVAYHPPIFSGLKRLRAGQPKEQVVVRALRHGLTIYSPHTALDAVSGGMTEWLGRALGPGRMSPISAHERDPRCGAGRLVRLDRPVGLERAIQMAKAHLGLRQLRVSRAAHDRPITTVAVCPGAGGAVFEKVPKADLLLTGEMRHHDLLERRARGSHVLLTDHTNTERGYLPHLAQDIVRACPGLAVQVSRRDADPLCIE